MGNGEAKSPTLGRDRSNKLKEVLDGGGRGYPGNRRRGGAGWKTVDTCRNWREHVEQAEGKGPFSPHPAPRSCRTELEATCPCGAHRKPEEDGAWGGVPFPHLGRYRSPLSQPLHKAAGNSS